MKKSVMLFLLVAVFSLCFVFLFACSTQSTLEYEQDWSSDENGHWHALVRGDGPQQLNYGEHTAEPDDGDCTTPVLCSICGTVMVGAKTHVAEPDDGDCTTPVLCSICGTVMVGAKTHVAEPDDGDCTTPVLCSICGTVMVGAKTHVAEPDDGDCTTPVLCSICDTVMVEAKTHVASTSPVYDPLGHHYPCTNPGCVKNARFEAHTTTNAVNMCTVCHEIDGGVFLWSERGTISEYIGKSRYLTLIIPNCTEIAFNAFKNNSTLKTITLPNNLKTIGTAAFEGCTALKTISIPDSVTSLGNRAFKDCTSLESVTIGNGITTIENFTFSGLTSLTDISFGVKVSSIKNNFQESRNLTSAIFQGTAKYWEASPWGVGDPYILDFSDPQEAAAYLKNSIYASFSLY